MKLEFIIPKNTTEIILKFEKNNETKPEKPKSKTTVMGYWASWLEYLLPAKDIYFNYLTHLCVGKARPSENINEIEYKNWMTDEKIIGIVSMCNFNSVKPILMLGGSIDGDGVDSTPRFEKHAKNPVEFAKTIVTFCKKFGFKGVDIDWEPVAESSYFDITKLFEEIRKQWPQCYLTFPCQWPNKNYQNETNFELFIKDIHKLCDKINVMSYAMVNVGGGWNAHHSSAIKKTNVTGNPSSIEYSIEILKKMGVPDSKIGVGIGAFGVPALGVTNPQQSSDKMQIIGGDPEFSFDFIEKNYKNQMVENYDAENGAVYLNSVSPVGIKPCNYISYETPQSVKEKFEFCKLQNVNSFIIWTLNQDSKGLLASVLK